MVLTSSRSHQAAFLLGGTMAYANTLREEELKNKVANDYFNSYDCTKIIGNIDFCVAKITDRSEGRQSELFEETTITQSLLWAEAKRGNKHDIYESFVQLIMTIGKARTFEKHLPPIFLGAFDAEKIAFIQYNVVSEIFNQNDFDWTVTSSNHNTKEFTLVYNLVKDELERKSHIFLYDTKDKELRTFIKNNFVLGRQGVSNIAVTKNNFVTVYFKWLQDVKPTIKIDWEKAKQQGIYDRDFYLADLLSKDNVSIKESLFVLLSYNKYEIVKENKNELGLQSTYDVEFNDGQRAHRQFWCIYDRPPRKEFWNYIVERQDLLVSQDIRERKGSYFTPQRWVELSQKYLEDVLGENWQDEYYVWDCCAGTGNLLNGLTNKYNIWASTLDKADVDVMKDRIKNGANLLASHVFQMDFLNDRFEEKCPKGLLDIISNPEKRKKLVIYINPPYAEAGSGSGRSSKDKVAISNHTYGKYKNLIGNASNELFAQFFTRIYKEIPNCWLAEFSTLKILQASNFSIFRQFFLAKLEKMFIVPADTFDNVKGQFPIGFIIWNTTKKEQFSQIMTDVYTDKGNFLQQKNIITLSSTSKVINDWLRCFYDKVSASIGIMHNNKNDFQHNTQVRITSLDNKDHTTPITYNNILNMCIYLSVRHCIEATWLNDRDQFLYPNDGWKDDKEFQADCLAYTLFHGQNRISANEGVNHWIPFREHEVDAKDEFQSHFMTDYIKEHHLNFSNEALAVFDAGRELWRYYHKQPNAYVNASFYDIRAYFQGRDEKGKMKKDSKDTRYNELISGLRQAMKLLAKKIEPKVYEYGFLRK
jgi:hypothetical protein